MILVLLRAAVVAVALTVPFVLLALSQGKSDGILWLLFPFLFFIPVLAGSLLLLAPFEALIERLGMNANLALPMFGGLIGAIVVAVAARSSRQPHFLAKVLDGDMATTAATAGIVLVGAAVGGVWRASLWAVKSLHWA